MTRDVLIASGYEPASEPHTVTFNEGEPTRLSSDEGIFFEFFHRYTIRAPTGARQEWAVSSAEYIYELLDRDGHLVIGFHWHPRGSSPATWPHVHVPKSSPYRLGEVHPPTGRVSVEAVIRFAIRELGVRPLRADWEIKLDRSEQRFRKIRTWS